MRRRSGQSGTVTRKGNQWHVRYMADTPEGRKKKSVPVGPAAGKGRLTKAEAKRKGAELIEKLGVNTEAHLAAAQHPDTETFRKRVEWFKRNRGTWRDAKKSTIKSFDSHLQKHLLPRFGDLLISDITERQVQELIADLARGAAGRPLSRKTIVNITGLLKLVVGRKVWKEWEELDFGRPTKPKQRYFTESQLKRIIEAAPGQYRVLFALLAGTGVRIGEAAGLHVEDVDLDDRLVHVRRSVFDGEEITPKTEAGIRDIDIDEALAGMLRSFIGDRTSGLLFQSKRGTPLAHGNLRNRVLHPLLDELGIPRAGLHAFRHSRVTMLRKAGTPADLQTKWIGHSALKTGDRYNHAHEELDYRQRIASSVGMDRVLGPKQTQDDTQGGRPERSVKRSL